MARVVYNLKRIFKKSETPQTIPPFKQFNYLNSMEQKDLVDLLHFSQQRVLAQTIPDLSTKNVLFISFPSTVSLVDTFIKFDPALLMNYQVHFNANHSRSNVHSLTGSLNPLSVKKESFDAVFFPVASLYQKDFLSSFKHLGQTLKNGGRAFICVVHPALELFLYNQNPSSASKAQLNFQSYFSGLKENNLYLEELIETNIDKETKVFFKDSRYFDEFKGLPLVLFLRAVKFQK